MSEAAARDAGADGVDSEQTREFVFFLDPDGVPKRIPEGAPVEWRICCYAVIRRSDGKILFVLPRWGDRLELPGGGMKLNESMGMCLGREGFEETGFFIHPTSEHPLYMGEANVFLPHKNRYFHLVYVVFPCKIDDGQDPYSSPRFSDTEEIRETRWELITDLTRDRVHSIHHALFQLSDPFDEIE